MYQKNTIFVGPVFSYPFQYGTAPHCVIKCLCKTPLKLPRYNTSVYQVNILPVTTSYFLYKLLYSIILY